MPRWHRRPLVGRCLRPHQCRQPSGSAAAPRAIPMLELIVVHNGSSSVFVRNRPPRPCWRRRRSRLRRRDLRSVRLRSGRTAAPGCADAFASQFAWTLLLAVLGSPARPRLSPSSRRDLARLALPVGRSPTASSSAPRAASFTPITWRRSRPRSPPSRASARCCCGGGVGPLRWRWALPSAASGRSTSRAHRWGWTSSWIALGRGTARRRRHLVARQGRRPRSAARPC